MFVLTNHLSMSVGYDAMLTKQDALADAYYKQVVLKVSQSVRDGIGYILSFDNVNKKRVRAYCSTLELTSVHLRFIRVQAQLARTGARHSSI